jgi:hypothetical protein
MASFREPDHLTSRFRTERAHFRFRPKSRSGDGGTGKNAHPGNQARTDCWNSGFSRSMINQSDAAGE